MAFANALTKLQAEASCPICLDYLRDLVTTACGHNLCPSCIHRRWEGLQGTFPCPVCLYHCLDRSLKRNTQLCHMTEIVQQIPTSGSQRKLQEDIPLCGKHNEVLTLFCEKNMELLCAQCTVSSKRHDQRLIPIEEAAASNRRNLKMYIGAFTNHLQNAEVVCKNQVANIGEVKRKMEKWRKEVDYECKNLKFCVEIEQDEVDNDLLIEENDVEKELIENGNETLDHMFRLSDLLSEIEEKCLQTDLDLLTDIGSIHNSYENIETPPVFSYELQKESFSLTPHYFGLHKMIHMFQVDLTLDPETAHPSLIILRNRKSAMYRTFGFHNPHELTSCPAVLSCEGFDAGRHFWEVNIEGTGEWSLGVCEESFPRNTLISPSPSNGCWTETFGPFLTGQGKIGVFLDYAFGEVSFYDWNKCSFLCRITATFTGKLMPYFSIASSSESLTTFIIRV